MAARGSKITNQYSTYFDYKPIGDLVTQASYDTFTSRFNELFDTCIKLFSLFCNQGNTELKSFVTTFVIFFESNKNIPFPS